MPVRVERIRVQDRLMIEKCYRVGVKDAAAWAAVLFGVAYIMAHLMLWGTRV